MENIKAIETQYKGYKFRSRLEARWAVFFDSVGIPWIYEPEGFDLPVTGKYLPDFYFPESGTYAEVKPTFPTDVEIKRFFEFCFLQNRPRMVKQEPGRIHHFICGTPGVPKLVFQKSDEIPDAIGHADPVDGYFLLGLTGIFVEEHPDLQIRCFAIRKKTDEIDSYPFYLLTNNPKTGITYKPQNATAMGQEYFSACPPFMRTHWYMGAGMNCFHDRLLQGYKKARQARFEFKDAENRDVF